MNNNLIITKNLIDKLKTINLFQRLFNWKSITVLLMDTIEELQKFSGSLEKIFLENGELKQQYSGLVKDHELLKVQFQEKELGLSGLKTAISEKEQVINDKVARIAQLETTINNLTEKVQNLELSENGLKIKLDEAVKIKNELFKENTIYKNNEQTLNQKYESNVNALNSIKDKIEKDRNREIEAAINAAVNHQKKQKETWTKHQSEVKSIIKGLAQKLMVEYVEKVPFKGEPDNTLRICGEYIAFDAKSPAGDDLTNFPSYVKDQAEKAKKYAKQENVKRDIFFVVPTNTLESLGQFVYHFADHDVYVISIDSLEQIILNLKKIESYDFADKLSPEERDNICRVIGKFVHITKRRVQIDAYFTKHFLEMAYQAEADLPSDILDKALEFEKSEKLNPPQEKRAKAINIKELEKENNKLSSEVSAKGIALDNDKLSVKIDEVNLYNKNSM